MTRNKLFCIAALNVVLLSNPGNVILGETISAVDAALPDELLGWRTVPDERVVYDRESLYDYIDGGAELYLSYGFHHLASCKYVQLDEPDIVVDLFDMGTSQNAFGVFSQSREVIEDAFGQGSQYTEGLLLFWKGRYYVSILASPETGRSKDAVFELARTIASAIPDEGPLPDVLARLPREGLVEESVRYFRHYIWLNSHYYVADENILHIEDTTHAVLAKYRRDGDRGTEAEICWSSGIRMRRRRRQRTTSLWLNIYRSVRAGPPFESRTARGRRAGPAATWSPSCSTRQRRKTRSA